MHTKKGEEEEQGTVVARRDEMSFDWTDRPVVHYFWAIGPKMRESGQCRTLLVIVVKVIYHHPREWVWVQIVGMYKIKENFTI